MMKTLSDDTKIMPSHLDKVQKNKDLDDTIYLIKNVDNSTCVIIFTSPQSITTEYPKLVHTIKTMIRFMVVDESHLFNSSEISSKDELSLLQSKLFYKLRKKLPMLFWTSTCMQHIQDSFEKMIGNFITHYDWTSAVQLSTRKVRMYAHYSERHLLNMFKAIKKTLLESSNLSKK